MKNSLPKHFIRHGFVTKRGGKVWRWPLGPEKNEPGKRVHIQTSEGPTDDISPDACVRSRRLNRRKSLAMVRFSPNNRVLQSRDDTPSVPQTDHPPVAVPSVTTWSLLVIVACNESVSIPSSMAAVRQKRSNSSFSESFSRIQANDST